MEGYPSAFTGDSAGRDAVLSKLKLTPEHFDDIFAQTHTGLIYLDADHRRLDKAAELLNVSLPLTFERDVPLARSRQLGERARRRLQLGDWDSALADAGSVLATNSGGLARPWPLLVQALASLRRDGSRLDDIDEHWLLAHRLGEPIRIMAAAAALAEWCWLSNCFDDRLSESQALLDNHRGPGLEWARGELAMWLHRLGADAFAARVRRDLRNRGIPVVPTRRHSSTLSNPIGITARQLDVLRMLAGGLTNAELAEQLYLSVKTVDKHVSAILDKLEVANRRDAVRRARELGMLDGG